jgi:hypothetical protein
MPRLRSSPAGNCVCRTLFAVRPNYELQLQTNAGVATVVSCRNLDFMKRVASEVHSVMTRSDPDAQYLVDFGTLTITTLKYHRTENKSPRRIRCPELFAYPVFVTNCASLRLLFHQFGEVLPDQVLDFVVLVVGHRGLALRLDEAI